MRVGRYFYPLLFVGFTAVFVGYLSVWLPGPAAGLRFLGLELGEWFKFLGLDGRRDIFYLPPITLGLMLALLTLTWPNRRRRTWVMRALAVLVSLLAFPALPDLLGPFRSQYLLRVAWIGLVALAAIVSSVKLPPSAARRAQLMLLALLGVVGAVLPAWLYLALRPFVSEILRTPVGIGPGVWLSGVGHLWVTAVCCWRWYEMRAARPD